MIQIKLTEQKPLHEPPIGMSWWLDFIYEGDRIENLKDTLRKIDKIKDGYSNDN